MRLPIAIGIGLAYYCSYLQVMRVNLSRTYGLFVPSRHTAQPLTNLAKDRFPSCSLEQSG